MNIDPDWLDVEDDGEMEPDPVIQSPPDYARRCRTGTPPHDINNPVFIRHCGPQHDYE
jgi:hypothetical protein